MSNYSLYIDCEFTVICGVVVSVVFAQDCSYSFSSHEIKLLSQSFNSHTNHVKFEVFAETEFQMKPFQCCASKTEFNRYGFICLIDHFVYSINKQKNVINCRIIF